MRVRILFFVLVGVVLVGASQLCESAELGLRRFGVRAGVSMNPDQFHGGLFLDAGRIVSDLRFQPSFEFGIGNGVRLGAVNLDALHPLGGSAWRPYAGGGLGINFIDVTNGVGEARGFQLETVVNIVGGVEWGSGKPGSGSSYRYVVEGRLGLGDTPDFKLSFGLAF